MPSQCSDIVNAKLSLTLPRFLYNLLPVPCGHISFLKSRGHVLAQKSGLRVPFTAFSTILPSANYSAEWSGQVWQPAADSNGSLALYTATAIPFIYSFSGNSVASAPISTFMCLWAIYIFLGSVYIFPPAEQPDPSWEYIIRSQTHECGNWDWGPDIPFLGIFVSNFRHFVFAVYFKKCAKQPLQSAKGSLTRPES